MNKEGTRNLKSSNHEILLQVNQNTNEIAAAGTEVDETHLHPQVIND